MNLKNEYGTYQHWHILDALLRIIDKLQFSKNIAAKYSVKKKTPAILTTEEEDYRRNEPK